MVLEPIEVLVQCSGPLIDKGIPNNCPSNFDIKLVDNDGKSVDNVDVKVTLKAKDNG